MRLAVAVLVAGALDLAVLLRIDEWRGLPALLAIGYLLLASAGAAFFARRRPIVAGGLAVVVGALLSGLVRSWPDLGLTDALGLLGFEAQLVVAFVPFAIGGAIAGLVGGALHRRLVRA
jgi:hypothetical protein